MTKEPPKGLRANLRSTYVKMDDDKLKRTCKPGDFRKMLFGELSDQTFTAAQNLNAIWQRVLHLDNPIFYVCCGIYYGYIVASEYNAGGLSQQRSLTLWRTIIYKNRPPKCFVG